MTPEAKPAGLIQRFREELEVRRLGPADGGDRRTVLPSSLVEPLKRHLQGVRRVHQADLAAGWGAVELPHALERKYRNAPRE